MFLRTFLVRVSLICSLCSAYTIPTAASRFSSFAKPGSSLKTQLLEAIAPLNKGRDETPEQRARVVELFEKLEKKNTEKKPLASANINGRWTLLWTTSNSILSKNAPGVLQSKGPIYQFIDVPNLKARNEEVLKPLPFVSVQRAVDAELEPLSSTKTKVVFKKFTIGPLKIKAPATAVGTLDITYLDKDLRLSRGDKGSLFILAKE